MLLITEKNITGHLGSGHVCTETEEKWLENCNSAAKGHKSRAQHA